MTAPFIHPRRLERIFSPRRDTPRAYPSPVTGNKTGTYPFREWLDVQPPVDPIELLRERIREDDRRKGQRIALLLNLLCWGVIVGCVWLLVSGAL